MNSRPVVLIADDEPAILELIVHCLDGLVEEVLRATDGEQALALALERRPDLAVLDVMMPKIDGLAVTRALRENAETRAVPIILVSAAVHDTDVQAGLDAGADRYMKKPFRTLDLRAQVEAALSEPRQAA